MYATIENGKFTGAMYDELTQAVIDHHTQYNLTYIKLDKPLINIGTDEEPDYGAPTQEELSNVALAEWKASRAEAVGNIKITVDNMLLDGDETSQTRMARAIISMNDTDTILWVLADNTPATLTKLQLATALKLAGEAQTALWLQ